MWYFRLRSGVQEYISVINQGNLVLILMTGVRNWIKYKIKKHKEIRKRCKHWPQRVQWVEYLSRQSVLVWVLSPPPWVSQQRHSTKTPGKETQQGSHAYSWRKATHATRPSKRTNHNIKKCAILSLSNLQFQVAFKSMFLIEHWHYSACLPPTLGTDHCTNFTSILCSLST